MCIRDRPATQRSRHVRGPLSAIVTYMLSFGWVPRGPTDWVLPASDHDWRFPADGFSGVKALDNFDDFLADVRVAAMSPHWSQAAQHFDGEGIQDGIDT
eukprot:4776369-Pyramimonas_sp.AAC.1